MSTHSSTNKQRSFAFQGQNLIVSTKLFCAAKMRRMEPSAKYPDSARRAKALRIYCGYDGHGNQKKFADWIGATGASWGNVERGVVPFSKRMARLIKNRVPAIDKEWLEDGYQDKMPPILMREINQILDSLEDCGKGSTSPR